jgi:hypothetical protein
MRDIYFNHFGLLFANFDRVQFPQIHVQVINWKVKDPTTDSKDIVIVLFLLQEFSSSA